jgi:hypothetical protein
MKTPLLLTALLSLLLLATGGAHAWKKCWCLNDINQGHAAGVQIQAATEAACERLKTVPATYMKVGIEGPNCEVYDGPPLGIDGNMWWKFCSEAGFGAKSGQREN